MANGKIEPLNRADLRRNFLEEIGWGDKEPTFLAGDASNRTYYRITSSRGHTAVLMDAHEPSEKIREFMQIGSLLYNMGYAVPEIIASDLDRRLILLEDLGDKTFTFCLENNQNPHELYEAATKVIIDLHQKFKHKNKVIPVYDLATYRRECDTLLDWYYPAIMGKSISSDARNEWSEIWNNLLTQKISLPRTLVLRDFHVDNLIWLHKRSDLQRCGLLDFQDALLGSPAYDLVSLFEDARRDVSGSMTTDLLNLYFKNFPELAPEQFMKEYNILGAHRSAKIIGYFARLALRDNKKRYLDFIPRTWKWLEQDMQHPDLKDIKNWMDKHIPKEKRMVPNVSN
tara:strand:- start:61761 stop:62786 length:1026 start_codon:yes stop_codon:yes gene_type:complete